MRTRINAVKTTTPNLCSISMELSIEEIFSQAWSRGISKASILSVLVLLVSGAPDAGLVPESEILPLNDTQLDLSLVEVVERINKHLPSSRKSEAYRLGRTVLELSERHQISPALILAVVEMESSYRFTVVSSAGAVGLMQLRPTTAKYIAQRYKVRGYRSEADLRNPEINLRLGVAYLAHLRRQFGHSLHYLAAYNVGPTALKKRLNAGRYELGSLDSYVRKIHGRTRELQGGRVGNKFPRLIREQALYASSI